MGVGTVYRHFPTPEALVLAVYRREVQHLVDVSVHVGEAPLFGVRHKKKKAGAK